WFGFGVCGGGGESEHAKKGNEARACGGEGHGGWRDRRNPESIRKDRGTVTRRVPRNDVSLSDGRRFSGIAEMSDSVPQWFLMRMSERFKIGFLKRCHLVEPALFEKGEVGGMSVVGV